MKNLLQLNKAKKMLGCYTKKYHITEKELAKAMNITIFTLRKIKERHNLASESWCYVYSLARLSDQCFNNPEHKISSINKDWNKVAEIQLAQKVFNKNWETKEIAKLLKIPYSTLIRYRTRISDFPFLPWKVIKKMALLSQTLIDIEKYQQKKLNDYRDNLICNIERR